ncbi:GNAT family N-acetyltransferase [Aliiglaciecola sp. 3_MG-2023]|uniref:GNAT family N-acetyltransferase n=1 Tax=Aliiglaciecola sp. 3_MG-2023 TaxID=3062644 RepID=UPI0026E3F9CF|nr:GNAT family N-acetyltransferase [Aliiglaciecola sp. 3_MG-2023]MDO6691745.1 GNAT family N-acetyltransferase [Aliiglaciecola sp. 3_MG-2023]
MEQNQILTGYQVSLREVQEKDLPLLRQWRNDTEIRQFMVSQTEITEEQQSAWFRKVSRDPSQQHFMISYKDQDIGSVNIQSRELGKPLSQAKIIEPGLYIGEAKYRNNIIAFSPTLLINDYCFESLKCQKLVAKVKSNNQAALNYNLKLGYQIVKPGDLIEISLNFDDYQRDSKALKALLSRTPRKHRE